VETSALTAHNVEESVQTLVRSIVEDGAFSGAGSPHTRSRDGRESRDRDSSVASSGGGSSAGGKKGEKCVVS
jgi:hypothetical protein